MPRPIRFELVAELPQSPQEIAALILDLDQWPNFEGWGPLPGIRRAAFEHRAERIVGSRIRCENTDNSAHTEHILVWDPARELRLRLDTFSRPLSLLASYFEEAWLFEPGRPGQPTRAKRTFELHPRSAVTRPLVWVIGRLLRKAIQAQLKQLARGEPRGGSAGSGEGESYSSSTK